MTAHGRARELLASPDEPTRLRGVHLLRDDAADADAAVLLAETLSDPGSYVPHAARAALTTLGAIAFPALFETLESPAPTLRCHALWALAAPHGPAAERVSERITRLASDPDRSVRHAVAGVLGRLDADASSVAERLAELGVDHEARVREEAAESMGLRPDVAALARPALRGLLDDGHGGVRAAAARSLAGLTPDAETAALALEILADEIHEPARLAFATLVECWGTG